MQKKKVVQFDKELAENLISKESAQRLVKDSDSFMSKNTTAVDEINPREQSNSY